MSTTFASSPAVRRVASRPRALATQTVPVLHVINGEHYAGAERVQDLLAGNLGQFGYRAGLACLKRGQFAQMRQFHDAPLYDVAMGGRFDLSAAWRVARIVREEGYRLIHSHTARSALVASAASLITGVPMVHHVHSPAGCDTTHPWRNRINAATERLALRRASALIAVSESLGRHVAAAGFSAEKLKVVPNGVAGRAAVPARDPRQTSWTLGAVALFRPRKGLEVLLDALAALRRQGAEVRLRAVGGFETPEYETQIKRLAGDLGVGPFVDWVGFTRDVDSQLAQMDLFVLPSLFGEGLPMVVLEAMSAGLPVIATRVEGVPEAIRDGSEGLLVPAGDAAGLAGAVARFMDGQIDWAACGSRARRRHSERFSDVEMAAGVARVYDRVLSGKKA